VKAQYPTALVIEIKKTSAGQPISTSTCNQWVSTFNTTHMLLRDDGSAATALGLANYDLLVLNPDLKIVYRGTPSYSSTTKNAVLAELAKLVP